MGKLITKTNAARQLLDRALALFLDQRDFLAATVLAGAAEDVFRDYLLRAGKEPSRDSIANGTVQIANLIDPNGEPLKVKDVANAMRLPYNWPRHHDRDDPDSLEIDWEEVAEQIISRACNDMAQWTSDLPLRVNEFDERRKNRQVIERKACEITVGDWIIHDSQLALVREARSSEGTGLRLSMPDFPWILCTCDIGLVAFWTALGHVFDTVDQRVHHRSILIPRCFKDWMKWRLSPWAGESNRMPDTLT